MDAIEVYKIINQLDRVSINKFFFPIMDETTTRENSLKKKKNFPLLGRMYSRIEVLTRRIRYQITLCWHVL